MVPYISLPSMITITSSDSSIPLPDDDYLVVHCRVAEILEVSGLWRKFDDALEDGRWDPENVDPNGFTDLGSIISRKMLTHL